MIIALSHVLIGLLALLDYILGWNVGLVPVCIALYFVMALFRLFTQPAGYDISGQPFYLSDKLKEVLEG